MKTTSPLFSHRGQTGTLSWRAVIGRLVVAAVLTAICIAWIDRPLARLVDRWFTPGTVVPENIPDMLALFVACLSLIMLLVWILSWWTGRMNTRLARLSPLIAFGLPLSFGAKLITKWIFGRTETRMFLSTRHSCDFCHWFGGYGPYNGFPSGHMLVMTVALVLTSTFYPRFRHLATVLLVLLGIALLLSSYHFLGDIIAGWAFGYALAWIILRVSTALRRERGAQTRP